MRGQATYSEAACFAVHYQSTTCSVNAVIVADNSQLSQRSNGVVLFQMWNYGRRWRGWREFGYWGRTLLRHCFRLSAHQTITFSASVQWLTNCVWPMANL